MKSEILYLNESLTENTMGQRLSSKENKIRCDEFESEMNELHIPFIKIVGSYGNKENSYILPNLDIDIAEEIFGYNGYDQESFIVGESNADAEDFFSSKKNWKFKIDFSIFR